jgi:hypothetical protein
MSSKNVYDGGCTCREVRYRLHREPMIVHCCHCRWCQRESGASFALNGFMEPGGMELMSGTVEVIDTPSFSGIGQLISRCPTCRVALWSNYSSAGDALMFIKIGTLDNPDAFPPDIHIFTSSKQPWVNLDGGAPAVLEYYRRSEIWPEESIERYRRAMELKRHNSDV